MPPEAIEQCAYCHSRDPVTYYDIGAQPDAALTARIPICTSCFDPTGQ